MRNSYLHERFRLHVNSKDVDEKDFKNSVDIDNYLEMAQRHFVMQAIDRAEAGDRAIEDLRVLFVPNVELKKVGGLEDRDLFELPKNYLKVRRNQIKVSKDSCCEKGKKEFLTFHVRRFNSDQISEALLNPNWRPDYNWEQSIGFIAEDKFVVFHNNEYTIESLKIDYFRKPNRIYTPTSCAGCEYISEDGRILTKDSVFELTNAYQVEEIIKLSVLYALRDFGYSYDFNSQATLIGQERNMYNNN